MIAERITFDKNNNIIILLNTEVKFTNFWLKIKKPLKKRGFFIKVKLYLNYLTSITFCEAIPLIVSAFTTYIPLEKLEASHVIL